MKNQTVQLTVSVKSLGGNIIVLFNIRNYIFNVLDKVIV